MDKRKLLNQFPERKFSDLLKEKLKSVQDVNNSINETMVDNYLSSKEPIFNLEKLIFDEVRNALISSRLSIIPDYLSKKILDLIEKFNFISSKLLVINGSGHNLESIFGQLEGELREIFDTKLVNIQSSETFLDVYIDRVIYILGILRNENNNSGINNDIIQKIETGLVIAEKLKNVESAIDIGESLLSIDKENIQKSVHEISSYYNNESENIKESEKKLFKNLKRFYNFYWIIGAMIFLAIILCVEAYLLISNEEVDILVLLPIYSILTIFILFCFKQYNRNIELYNSYRFKAVSTEFMSGLLDFRKESPEDSKLIIEKTLDKILEDPSSKKSSDSVNLMTNNIKTPTS